VYFRKENGNITGNKIEDRISFVRKFSILKFMMQVESNFYFSTY
jgi:hypothetical protein